MRYYFLHFYFTAFIILSNSAIGQHQNNNELTVMFYNVQNYFDTINNPLAIDEFTPDDIYEWTHKRFVKKRDAIAQVILAIDNNNPPDLIGLCEVENYFVLQQLLNNTALKNYSYSILHHDSPDIRGIDVALLYRSNRFQLLDSSFFLMGNAEGNKQKREILYAKGIVEGADTLHIFVNHFPSKIGGVAKTAPLRMSAAKALTQSVDSILKINPKAHVLVMGDFNDTYNSKALKEGLGTFDSYTNINDTSLYNLSAQLAKTGEGSIKYNNRWQLVDMFLTSGSLLNPLSKLYCSHESVKIFKADFLLEYVPATNNYRPKATYRWIKYIGGYSDHLPILLRLHINKK